MTSSVSGEGGGGDAMEELLSDTSPSWSSSVGEVGGDGEMVEKDGEDGGPKTSPLAVEEMVMTECSSSESEAKGGSSGSSVHWSK